MEHHKGKQATCKEEGEKEYWYCTRCKKYFLDEKGTKETTKAGLVISATGHKMEHHDRKEATNKQAGNIEYWYCGYCGKYYADQACSEEITLADTVLKFVSEEENPPVDQNDPATVDPKDPAGSDNTPKTGDESGIMLFVLLLAASASAAVIAMRKRKE